MAKIPPKMKMSFSEYVEEAEKSAENLGFLLDNLGYSIDLDYSLESVEKAEKALWDEARKGIPEELASVEQFADLLGQYLGQCLVNKIGAKWVQGKENYHYFGQPCIDGFGNEIYDRIYPVEVSRALHNLPQVPQGFQGVMTRRVFGIPYERAMWVYNYQQKKKA